MENKGLVTYTLISKWGFPKTYRGKIMLVAFVGAHAPLLGAALYLLVGSSVGLGEALRLLALLVAVTLLGTGCHTAGLGRAAGSGEADLIGPETLPRRRDQA